MLISHMVNMTNAFDAQQMIFAIYVIENGTINGKAFYRSDDGTLEIWYGVCGVWIIGTPTDR